MNISVIMPFFNRWDLTHNRIMELYKFTSLTRGDQLILVDDFSEDVECKKGISFWKGAPITFELLHLVNEKNMGFGYSMNRGAKKAENDILVFLSNDVRVREDFIKSFRDVLEKTDSLMLGCQLVDWPAGWNQFGDFYIPYLNGWLLATRHSIWKELGGFDWKTYGKYDYEDVDLSTAAICKGIRLQEHKFYSVTHSQGGTVNEVDRNRVNQTERNRQKFIAKWKDRFPEIKKKVKDEYRLDF